MKRIYSLMLAFLTVFATQAAMISLDFRPLLTKQTQEDMDAQAVLDFLNSQELSKDAVTAIPYCELAFGRNDGLKSVPEYNNTASSDYGALFIGSTDPYTNEETGGITFVINPKKWVRATKIVMPTYNYPDNPNTGAANTTPPVVMISVNGGEYQECPYKKQNNFYGSFTLEVEGTVVKEFSVKVPNVLKKITSNPTSNYYLTFTRFNVLYDEPQTAEKVTKWEFETDNRTVFLNETTSIPLPTLTAEPEQAGELAIFTSDTPETAEIVDNIIKLKGTGDVKISATLPDNSLFLPDENYAPAIFNLKIENSQATAVELTYQEDISPVYYDLCGRLISGTPSDGIYVKKTGSKVEKIVVR